MMSSGRCVLFHVMPPALLLSARHEGPCLSSHWSRSTWDGRPATDTSVWGLGSLQLQSWHFAEARGVDRTLSLDFLAPRGCDCLVWGCQTVLR